MAFPLKVAFSRRAEPKDEEDGGRLDGESNDNAISEAKRVKNTRAFTFANRAPFFSVNRLLK